jgi:hypothetical protein
MLTPSLRKRKNFPFNSIKQFLFENFSMVRQSERGHSNFNQLQNILRGIYDSTVDCVITGSLVGGYQRFGGTYHLHLQDRKHTA